MIASENDQLKKIYTERLRAGSTPPMKTRGAADFVSATPAQQTALLDLIAYRRNQSPELTPGIEFFTWVRRMTVDAFYTSEIGIKDIDYRGNSPDGGVPVAGRVDRVCVEEKRTIDRSLGRSVVRSFGKAFRSQSFGCDLNVFRTTGRPDDRATGRPDDRTVNHFPFQYAFCPT